MEWERWNLRKVDETDPLRQMDRQAAQAARVRAASSSSIATTRVRQEKPWDQLDRALRATDLVLQSGGFRVIILDLASVEPNQALRIPSATWFRYRRAAQESDAILLLLPENRAPDQVRPACSNARRPSRQRSRASLPPHHVLRRSPGNERPLT